MLGTQHSVPVICRERESPVENLPGGFWPDVAGERFGGPLLPCTPLQVGAGLRREVPLYWRRIFAALPPRGCIAPRPFSLRSPGIRERALQRAAAVSPPSRQAAPIYIRPGRRSGPAPLGGGARRSGRRWGGDAAAVAAAPCRRSPSAETRPGGRVPGGVRAPCGSCTC